MVASCSPPSLPPPSVPQVEHTFYAPGTATEVYAQVARGALRCWFGADGVLRETYIFHADAEPAAKGGGAEIVIHERQADRRDVRGPRAFRIAFVNVADGVRIGVTNLKMPPDVAGPMTAETELWARGGFECRLRPQPRREGAGAQARSDRQTGGRPREAGAPR
jgi:hypothetical protein